jgi:hypothetical protein
MTYQQNIEDHGFVPMDHESPLYFPVSVKEVQTIDGVTAPNWRAIVDDRSGDVMHVHTDSYGLVTNEEIYTAFDDAITKSTLDCTDMVVKDDISHNGCRAFRQYLFPAHQVEIQDKDAVALRIVAFNSYDGSLSFQARSGAYQFVCANTLLLGSDFANIKRKHTASFNANELPNIAENVTKAAETFFERAQMFKDWGTITRSIDQAITLFEAIPGATKALTDTLIADLVRETGGRDGTLWEIYCVLTSWSTHATATGDNRAYTQSTREERVLKLTNTNAWKGIAA